MEKHIPQLKEDPVERPSDMLYHAGISNPDDELEFLTVTDYEKFMKDNNLYKEGARRIIITGQMADATDLIKALEKEGYNVYPVQSMTRFMSFIDEVQPDAVINMAHGRMGDRMVDYLKTKNILLFAHSRSTALWMNGKTIRWVCPVVLCHKAL